ncbi:MAG: GTP-binding protein [Asgard group archaeon]|nr:GTP-binding protein [Asgard group archaeon]
MSFLKTLFKSRTKHVNMTICGLDKAGKTTILNYLVKGEYYETLPTMGVNRDTIDFPKLRINVFDLGGQEDFRGLWNQINEKSDSLVFVVDSTDSFRLHESKEIFYNIINTQINEGIPVLILLNKVDLENRISRSDFLNEFELLQNELPFSWACYETSAKTGLGIFDSFSWFIQTLKEV